VIGVIPIGGPLDIGLEHVIELEEGENPLITKPYRHTNNFRDEIKKVI